MARLLALVLLTFCATVYVASGATTSSAYASSYDSFDTAVSAIKQATLCRQIIDGLNLKTTMSNPKLALTIFVPSDDAFKALATKLKLSTATMTSSMTKKSALMKQIMYYHFVTGSDGAKAIYPTWSLKPGMKLDTMYISTTTKKPYQLAVAAVTGSNVLIKSVGTSAYTFMPNIKCGAGVAQGIDNLLLPLALETMAKFV